jgi:hypothetical protein
MKELCNEFNSTGKDWSQERTENLYSFGIRWGDPLRFNWSELDKSLKACEISAIDVSRRVEFNELYGKIYKFMGQMSDEYKRIRK